MFKTPKVWLLSVFMLAGCPGAGDRINPQRNDDSETGFSECLL
ncbi:hypothetical protein BN137_1467 [Cronobacter condimenti 1330]|uniref:Lipoprotein n=1 Tax=Cronobacter condimenti 1330 TaxID=1073999 RepID=K8ACY4_9ENTR|nr:hypothetical protein BN137_1467 [Cronobacter condimenti 1330]